MSDQSNSAPLKGERRYHPRGAIRKHCRQCNGDESPANCTATSCPAFPLRLSKAEPGADTGLRTIRAICLDCAGSAENVRSCDAGTPSCDGEVPACILWPYRDGKRDVTEEYRDARRSQANKQHREPGTGGTFAPQGAAKE